ncbi:MAG: leucyl aminopeptidase [Actinomycetota bacterium]|nr:leucyl aminopeptidase [Actinomycetota bacterium]
MADLCRGIAVFQAAAGVPVDAEVLGVPVFADGSLPEGAGASLDQMFLTRCGFEGRAGQSQVLPADDGTIVVALGVGARTGVDGDVVRKAGAALGRHLSRCTVAATTLALAGDAPALGAAAVEGIALGGYTYAGSAKSGGSGPERVVIVGGDGDQVRFGAAAALATVRARDWVNEPAGTLTPSALAAIAVELGRRYGFAVDVWDEERIAAERLGGLEGVSKGADEPARLLRLSYEPAGASRTVALVGKGITFDSGGLSIKTAASMMTMKSDMGGAAAVIAAVAAAAELGLAVRVTGWVASTENMVNGGAIRPGDILTVRNGTTIEVLNTDAEGRLVLADALALAAEESPDAIVDIATLTGAQRVALGPGVAAVMGNDDALVARVLQAADRAGEPAWRLPLVAAYRSKLDSDVADLKNVASNPAAGSIMAGLLLGEFVAGRPWAHLDIASPSWSDTDDGWLTRGATGWGARTLLQLLAG